MRVVLDTNVLVSGLAYPRSIPGGIVSAWRHGSLEVVLSHSILDELKRVLPRLAHRHGLNIDEIDDLVGSLMFLADIVDPDDTAESSLRDRADLPVLGTLLASGADYLISGDRDLLALCDRFPIISPAQFWQRHGA